MYLYQTPDFLREVAQNRQHQAQIDTLVERASLVRTPKELGFDSLSAPYWKYRIATYRIIGRVQKVSLGDEEYLCLCLVAYLHRNDNRYGPLCDDTRRVGERFFGGRIDHAKLQEWTLEQVTQHDGKIQLEKLPNTLNAWLQPPNWQIEDSTVIYEGVDWVRRCIQDDFKNYKETYHRMVLTITSIDPAEDVGIEQLNESIEIAECNGQYILYCRLTFTEPSRQIIFLLASYNEKPSQEKIEEYHAAFLDVLQSEKAQQGDIIASFARRSYPDYILVDYEIWGSIQQEKEANLALSVEEEELLWNISQSSDNTSSLPVFINGRAGSGKSTMLMYLFADYCHRKMKEKSLEGKLLYLTYNDRLLEVARDSVKKLLTSHARFVGDDSELGGLHIQSYFQPFRNFLLELLPPEERDNFDSTKYISFFRFKQLLRQAPVISQHPQAKRLEPELCWYVVRTLIKGYSLEFMNQEDYPEIPRRDRIVPEETFNIIHGHVWEVWYKRIREDGYWDDQDLIRSVLQHRSQNSYQPEYAVIFCDEAQDFTRIELQFILSLSLFSCFDMSYQPVKSLPFAFAGDPYQTLNPTGFRWSSLRATFHTEIIDSLDTIGSSTLQMNEFELTLNYRSTLPIVRFTNLIQLWRHVLFSLKDLKPQRSWQQIEAPAPQKFILGSNLNSTDLKVAHDTIIIIPCEEGQELEYIQQDQELKGIFDGNETPRNVLSAISAKGLEFERVILYKFGEECPEKVWQLSDTEETQRTFEYEYFFNKFYVAASRAMHYLFVVDTKDGERKLWSHTNPSTFDQLRPRAKRPDDWKHLIQSIDDGVDATHMKETDPVSVARQFEMKGKADQNPDMMHSARYFYQLHGDQNKAEECKAWALQFDGYFQQAGDGFASLGKRYEARDCYWFGICWESLRNWYTNHEPTSKSERYHLAQFMCASSTDQEAILEFTSFLTDELEKIEKQLFLKQWKVALEEYGKRVTALRRSHTATIQFETDQWSQMGSILEYLGRQMLHLLENAGYCFYQAQQYEKAVECWEHRNNRGIEKDEYYDAKAQVLGLPDGIPWLEKLPEGKKRILDEWRKSGSPQKQEWLDPVSRLLFEEKKYHEAFAVYHKLDNLPRMAQCIKEQDKTTAEVWHDVTLFIHYHIEKASQSPEKWSNARDVMNQYLTTIPKKYEKEKQDLRFFFVRELAYSSLVLSLSEDTGGSGQRRGFEKFLRPLITDASGWKRVLSIQEMGAAIERSCGYQMAINFYEKYLNAEDRDNACFARQRWIVAKKRQEEYLRNRASDDDITKANRIKGDINKRVREWQMNVSDSQEDVEKLADQLPVYPELPRRWIRGLPIGVELHDDSFTINTINIQVIRMTRIVIIINKHTGTPMMINLKQKEINPRPDDTKVSGPNSKGLLEFQVGDIYRGEMYYASGDRVALRLYFQDIATPITINP